MPKYNKVLFMSYAVPTFYPTPSGPVAPIGTAPLVNLSNADLQDRAQRFVNVLYWTREKFKDHSGMTDDKTLKVFIAPEFYFRNSSIDEVNSFRFDMMTYWGSYPAELRYELAEAIYDVIHGQNEFKDWSIIAGTITSRLPGADESLSTEGLLNTTIFLRGKRDKMDESVPYILMEKHYISPIDGPPKEWHANLNPGTVFSYELNPDQSLDNLIRWDDMMSGLEVCLDHYKGVLLDALTLLWNVVDPNYPPLDLQLVTSCGMDLGASNIVVKNGALALLTDGMSSRNWPNTPLTQLGRFDRNNLATPLQFYSLPELTVLPEGSDFRVTYPDYEGEQGIYAYDPVDLIKTNCNG